MAQNTLTVSYKGTNIVNEDISSEVTKTLLTSGKYCEGDILITAEGGSGGTPYAIISVTYPSGSVCTCTKGSTVLTAEDTSGKFNFGVPEAGTWTVACTNGTLSKTENVVIDTEHQLKIILLSYATPSLNENDWMTISTIAAGGVAESYWAVGDRKAITLNGNIGDGLTLTNYTTYVYILGFSHNGATNTIDFGTFKTTLIGGTDVCLADSKYNTQISIGTYFSMNNSRANANGWKGCRMRYYLLGSTNSNGADAGTTTATSPVANTLMAALPSDLRQVMKPMTIWTNNTGGSGDTASKVNTSVDYLPLLAEFEIFGSRTYANSTEQNHQKQYQYYANGNSKAKYRHNSTSMSAGFWSRSPCCLDAINFCFDESGGVVRYADANYSIGVSPIFRV